jgi:hypothetical protein
MHDTLRHSHEKDDVTHLERISSGSPHNEVEKGQQLAPTVSNGPIVHEKVRRPNPLQTVC